MFRLGRYWVTAARLVLIRVEGSAVSAQSRATGVALARSAIVGVHVSTRATPEELLRTAPRAYPW
jgi:hypothetical protein